jgi:ABC-type polysaccharide/polyol phosphate transport system ATPase subunit
MLGLGAGFNMELTGRENVYLGGATLGLSRAEMEAKFDQIVDFADLDSFIDAPFRTYSSGMCARLGFAVATAVEPDVLLLDEVIAVGDMDFRAKCERRITNFRERGATTLLVSHSMETVRSMCDRALLLIGGRAVGIGDPEEIIEQYSKGFVPASED